MTQSSRTVQWVKNAVNGEYFDLLRLNLNTPYFRGKQGVYIVWYTSPSSPKVIRVGHGPIGDRLTTHRSDPQIVQYADYGPLKVTWTLLDVADMNGVEAYLYDYYKPVLGERPQGVDPIAVTPLV